MKLVHGARCKAVLKVTHTLFFSRYQNCVEKVSDRLIGTFYVLLLTAIDVSRMKVVAKQDTTELEGRYRTPAKLCCVSENGKTCPLSQVDSDKTTFNSPW